MPLDHKDVVPSPSETTASRDGTSNRQQTVALEVPVSVNGTRLIDGAEKREPFSEATKTVLVHANGAVIRLAAAVDIGQLLFLTNDKSKKEVVCQVIKSKSHRNVSGYVELEFTEPVIGFWGMRFPNERTAPAAPTAAAKTVSAYEHVETNVEPLAGMDSPRPPTEVSAQTDTASFTGLTSAGSEATETLKTELRSDDHSTRKADFLAPASEISTESLKLENSKLQEQLSSLLFSEQQASHVPSSSTAHSSGSKALSDTTSKLLEMAEATASTESAEPSNADSAAPAKAPPSKEPAIEVEEVKIPAWLQPTAVNSPAGEPKEVAVHATATPVKQANKFESPEAPVTSPKRDSGSAKPAAPVFAKTLSSQSDREARSSSQGGKGIWIGVAAAIILVAAASVTWYVRQSPDGGANSISAATLPMAAASTAPIPTSSATSAAQPQAQTSPGLEVSPATGSKTGSAPVSDASLSSPAQTKAQPAVLSEPIAKPALNPDVAMNPTLSTPQPSTSAPEPAKPSLGNVRLAKPKVNRNARSQTGGVSEPALEMNPDEVFPNSNSLSSGLVGEDTKQPAAPPPPVGGDVSPARLLSSVPPVYPALAKTQHVAGEVRIDALIESNGRVSSMKVVSGPSLLHQAAMAALRQWKYQPATLDGKPVAMHLTVTIQFRLQ
jgi:periplasmic protein TonB